MTAPNEFRLLGEDVQLTPKASWEHAHPSKLVCYHLHYFDDLVAEGASERTTWHHPLLSDWLEQNPPALGTGWEPYVVSLRLVNWFKYWLRGDPAVENQHCSPELQTRLEDSAAVQTRWLTQRLETHLLGNHLWANAKALVFAGVVFDGPEAADWLRLGERLMQEQLAEQILADGGHFERSPMYQATLLEDLLDLLALDSSIPNTLSSPLLEATRKSAAAMLDWLTVMTPPDGRLSQFNDAAFGMAPELAELQEYASRLGVKPSLSHGGSILLKHTGYARLEAGNGVLLADVAEVGPTYIPGHAHADTLSFELSVDGQRVFVNGGTSTYERGTTREAERSTAAHNTVTVGARDSSEVWASFRVARRAHPQLLNWDPSPAHVALEASHNGYRRLPGSPTHRRSWSLKPGELWVDDRVLGGSHVAIARYRVHPDWQVDTTTDGFDLHHGNKKLCLRRSSKQGSTRATDGFWAPEFGVRLPCVVLEFEFSQHCSVVLTWNDEP